MNKNELVRSVAEVLKNNDIKKRIPIQRTVLHISDNDGNATDFVIHREERGYMFSIDDVESIVDAVIAVVEDSIQRGEDVAIHGFGSFEVRYMNPTKCYDMYKKKHVDVPGRYVAKFVPGTALKRAATLYSTMKNETDSKVDA